MWISGKKTFISLYSINRLLFINETDGVFCTVRTGSFLRDKVSSLRVKLLVFITEFASVYCAVRTGSLNKTDYFSSFKGSFRCIHLTDSVSMLVLISFDGVFLSI